MGGRASGFSSPGKEGSHGTDVAGQVLFPKNPEQTQAARRFAGRSEAVHSAPPLEETLDTLTNFISTETIVLYIASLSVDAGGKFLGPVFFYYWLFAVLSPVILSLLFLGRRKKAGLSLRIPIKDLPIWKLTAPTIAAFAALFVSIFLGLLDRIFDKPLPWGVSE